MNLSSLGPFSSLATNALDTARSTFKVLADAATDTGASTPASPAESKPTDNKPADQKAAERKATAAKRAETKRAELKLASKTEATPDTKFKARFGTTLDAYA